jgi:hypothetical protein
MLSNFRSRPITKRLPAIVLGLIVLALSIGEGQSTAKKLIWDWQNPPRINITHDDYERALSRWQSLKVEEYEITTDTKAFFGGTLTLRVSEYGRKIDQLAPKERRFATMSAESIEYLKDETIEGLFAEIDTILACNDVIKAASMGWTGTFYMTYQVQFDQHLGYPRRIIARPITAPGSYVHHADWDLAVTNLKIIKQGK